MRIHIRPDGFLGPIQKFSWTPNDIDYVQIELISAAYFLVTSDSVIRLFHAIVEELK